MGARCGAPEVPHDEDVAGGIARRTTTAPLISLSRNLGESRTRATHTNPSVEIEY
jgi:hypothetical protein